MNLLKFRCSALAIIAFSIIISCAGIPAPAASKPLSSDPGIVSGRLENGLAYYIRENDDPKGRLLVRLVVKTGSLDETGSESGVAHFVEHMAFNGTKSFPRNELVKYFESIGMNFGDELNASTTFGSTQYELEVPSDDPASVATAFKIIREWADGISFDPEEVSRERGVILEEERSGRSAGERVWKKQSGAVYGESLYRRDIIGTPESISSMDQVRLRTFYERFYRPDLMAVVVVGDVPSDALESQVRAAMGSIQKKAGPSPVSRNVGPVPGLRSAAAFDPELTSSGIEFGARVRDVPSVTEYDAIVKMRQGIAIDLINIRLSESIRRSGGSTVSGASVGLVNLGGIDAAVNASVSFTGEGWEAAMVFMKEELARIQRFGFSPEEVTRVQKETIAYLEDARQNGYSSAFLVGRLMDLFLRGNVAASIDDRIRLIHEAFSGFKPEEAVRIASLLLRNDSGFVLLSMPDSAAVKPATKTLSDAFLAPVRPLGPWKRTEASAVLMETSPESVPPAMIAERTDLGLLDMTYPNGMRVLLKKTDFEQDEIVFSLVSPVGTDSLSDVEFANVLVAASLIPAGGFTGIPSDALKEMLAGKNLSLSVFASETRTGLRGFSNNNDLEALFQVARRTMTDPVVDPGYYEMVLKNIAEYGNNFGNSPDRIFQAEIWKTIYPLRPRLLVFSKKEDVAVLDPALMKKTFEWFFCPPNGAILVLSGSFETDAARALCDRYIGSLPAGKKPMPYSVPPEARPVPGSVAKTVNAGLENKGRAVFIYKTPESGVDAVTVNGLDLLAASLDRSLRDRIREDKGGTYGVSVSAFTDPDRGFSVVNVSFEADPERLRELMPIVEDEVTKLAKSGIAQGLIDEIKLAARRDIAVSARKNGYWAQTLGDAALRGESLDILGALEAAGAKLDTEWTMKAARRYLDPANLAVFTLLPAPK